MKIITFILFSQLTYTLLAQSVSANSEKVPKLIDLTIKKIEETINDTVLCTFIKLPEKLAIRMIELKYGRTIRNKLHLGYSNEISQFFISSGLSSPEEMSSLLFLFMHRERRGVPLDCQSEIMTASKEFHERNDVKNHIWHPLDRDGDESYDLDIKQLFNVGDTVFVTLNFYKKRFSRLYAHSRFARAVVVEPAVKDFKVLLIEDYNAGLSNYSLRRHQIISVPVTSCFLDINWCE